MHAMKIPSHSGTYALLMHLDHEDRIHISKLGTFDLSPGIFIYIGSAHGPGGLAGRIKRHRRPSSQKRLHWHIDWLLQHASIKQIWVVESPKQLECAWSQTLSKSSERPIPGFGASDCTCTSHLYALRDRDHLQTALQDLQGCQPEQIQSVSWDQKELHSREITMARMIRIKVADLELEASLISSTTADAIWEALPLEGRVNRWGEEIYFSIPVEIPTEPEAREEMQIGECAYWPGGKAFCIFFGPTPVSLAQEPRAYTAVNPFGLIREGATRLTAARDGERIMIKAIEDFHP